LLRAVLGLPVWLYRAHLGRLLGQRFLLLVERGRTTGRIRRVVIEVVRFDPLRRESTVVAGWGRDTQWLRNVLAGGALEVQTGSRSYVPTVRILPADEATSVLADYERRNWLIAPLVRRVLGRLLGWPYDGGPRARARAVAQLEMVAFRPATATARDDDPEGAVR
jgi:deazaflavin-dependent oxidoreductase (nitroreductase family)